MPFEAALNQAGIPNEITIYEGQPHAFLTSMPAIRAGGAQATGLDAQMLVFPGNIFKGRSLVRNER
jgi:acetyl esterase/lipase